MLLSSNHTKETNQKQYKKKHQLSKHQSSVTHNTINTVQVAYSSDTININNNSDGNKTTTTNTCTFDKDDWSDVALLKTGFDGLKDKQKKNKTTQKNTTT